MFASIFYHLQCYRKTKLILLHLIKIFCCRILTEYWLNGSRIFNVCFTRTDIKLYMRLSMGVYRPEDKLIIRETQRINTTNVIKAIFD